MSQTPESIIDDIQRDYAARYDEPRRETVELGRVKDYLSAMDRPASVGLGDEVPALFLLTLGRTRRPQPSRGSAVNAGDEFEFMRPVYVGDTVTVQRRLIGVDVKQGKQGRMYLLRAEAAYTNQRGEAVAHARFNTLRWGLE